MTPAVPRSARSVAVEWRRLHHNAEPVAAYEPGMLDGLPEVARRLVDHALAPGVRLSPAVELTMRGQIRLGSWRRFTARQILAPGEGFVWAATASVAGLPVSGFDRYTSGEGEMRWRLLTVVPVVGAHGPDITRSSAGRLACEGVLCPTAFQRCRWQATGADQVTATWDLGGREEAVELRVAPDGRLREARMQRWGDPDGAPFGTYPFGVELLEERTFGGVRVPSTLRAGWWFGTDREAEGEFLRATITDAAFT